MPTEPIYDIAHLGHLEILTPKFEESRKFFIDVMGMTQSGEKGNSVYLRGWDDYERYSLKLTASKTSGMAHVAFRTRTPQALERRAAALKGSGFDVGWSDGDLGHGKTFVCKDPDGHTIELYYDTEWYDPPPDKKPALKNQAQRYPARGCNVRRIDHFIPASVPSSSTICSVRRKPRYFSKNSRLALMSAASPLKWSMRRTLQPRAG